MATTSVTCHVYDSEYMQTEDDSEGLHLWCLDRESTPIHILVKECPIYMYIELPETPSVMEWNSDFVDALYEDFRRVHGKCAPFMMEFTEREKLYYYRENQKTMMARLFFRSVRDMNICSYRLKKTQDYPNFGNLIFRLFEKDIAIRRKIFTIRKTRFCQWFRLDNAWEVQPGSSARMAIEGTRKRPIREFICDDYHNIHPIDPSETAGWMSRPRVLSFDIETYSDNHHSLPDKTNPAHVIYMISCLFQVTGDKSSREKYVIVSEQCDDIEGAHVLIAKDEEELLVMFLELIEHLDPEIMMGYNIFAYDYPYIDARFSMFRECYEPCSRLVGYIPEMSNMSWASGAYGQTIISHLKMPGRISIDLFPLIKRDYKFDKYTLDFVSKILLNASKHDVSAQQMFAAFESKDVNEMTTVTRYCIQDADLVLDLYEKMNVWIGLVEMANIVGVEIMEIFTRGQQIRCVSQIYDLTHRLQIILDSRDLIEMDYKGGFVGEPIVGIHENVIVIDFSSLYPSIMRAYNICYTTLIPEIYIDEYDPEDVNTIEIDENTRYHFIKAHIKKGILPQLVENLVNERNAVRKEKARVDQRIEELEASGDTTSETFRQLELTSTVLEKRQLGLKVSANSMYGFLGVQQGGKLPLMEGAISITAKGRQLINQVNEFLEQKYGATVVYNDTDSSMVTIPEVHSRKEANQWGYRIADEISGTPEVRDTEGNIIKPAVKGLFPPPLKMEFEKAMRFIGITKKKYAGFLIEDDGSFKLDRKGEEVIYKRGIVIARRDNFPYLRKVYTNVLRSILRRNPIKETFKMILDAVVEILSGKLPARGNLTFIRGLGKEYSSDTYFMKVFSDELARMGHPVAAGDRLEYVVVLGEDDKIPLGRRMRLIEMYEDSLNYDEETEGPRPPDVYPVEEIDYLYYLTNGLQNPVDQLFSAGYQQELYGTTLYYAGYTPRNSRSKMVNVTTPIKMMTTLIKDKIRKKEFKLGDCLDFLRDRYVEWFNEQVDSAEPLDEMQAMTDFGPDGPDED